MGRPIGDFTHRAVAMPPLPDPRTLHDALEPVMDEIRTGAGQYYLRRVLPYRNHGGQAAGMVVTFVDITERKRAEAALQESEVRLRSALAAGAMGAWDWDIPTGRTVWSEGHYTILGYRVGEIEPSYQAWSARVHPEGNWPRPRRRCAAPRSRRPNTTTNTAFGGRTVRSTGSRPVASTRMTSTARRSACTA